ncbi:MAG: hypothetical protein COA79_20090 [Planctomycetota bacterium]|nr:MAG: hypothetical protein COA79_20090 [Planctomycetota bacterium]
MKKLSILFSLLALSVCMSVTLIAEDHDHDHKGHDHGKDHIKATHGGNILEVGKHVAHIELVHDKKKGSITLYILDKAGKAMAIADAPRLNLKYKDGDKKKKKQIITKPQGEKDKKASEFKAVDNLFKTEGFKGKISIKIGDKKYQVELAHGHHDDHKGHDHDDHKGHKH